MGEPKTGLFHGSEILFWSASDDVNDLVVDVPNKCCAWLGRKFLLCIYILHGGVSPTIYECGR